MLAIIVTCLKIIGIILAVLVGMVIFMICFVLFVPFKYKLSASKGDEVHFLALNFGWLLSMLQVKVLYEEKFLVIARIFGIPVYRSDRQPKPKKEKKSKKKDKKSKKEEESNQDTEEPITEEPATEEPITEEPITEEPATEEPATEEPTIEEDTCQSKKDRDIIRDSELYETWLRVKEMIRSIWYIVKHYKEIMKREEFKLALKICFQQLLFLYRKMKPRKLECAVEYGDADPATTGKFLAYSIMLQPILESLLQFTPYFEEQVFRFSLKVYGRITVVHFLQVAIRLYRNREFRTILTLLTNKEGTNGRAK
ncbi:MAG: hypothetical protein R3Y67_05625 [Eubacteriales bacterium]